MARPLARHRAQGRRPWTAPVPPPRPGTPSCCLRPLPGRPQLWPSALALSSVPVLPGGLALPPGTVPLSCDAPHTRTPGGRGQPREGRLGPCPQAEGSVPTHGARPSVPAQGPRGQRCDGTGAACLLRGHLGSLGSGRTPSGSARRGRPSGSALAFALRGRLSSGSSHSDAGSSLLKILHSVTSANVLFPNQATLTGSGGRGPGAGFGGHSSTRYTQPASGSADSPACPPAQGTRVSTEAGLAAS